MIGARKQRQCQQYDIYWQWSNRETSILYVCLHAHVHVCHDHSTTHTVYTQISISRDVTKRLEEW